MMTVLRIWDSRVKAVGYIVFLLILVLTSVPVFAARESINVYIWANWLSSKTIHQFEKETGIRVNLSTYDNNETLYAKLKASQKTGYDVVAPTSYYIQRMQRQGMLEKLDKTKLSNFKNLDRHFLNKAYDKNNQFSVPFAWGITGIFLNTKYYSKNSLTKWSDFWRPEYKDQLLLLDDPRDVFPIALLFLGYPIYDANPKHIEEAYLALKISLSKLSMRL